MPLVNLDREKSCDRADLKMQSGRMSALERTGKHMSCQYGTTLRGVAATHTMTASAIIPAG